MTALDRVFADDARWFHERPRTRQRVRPITTAEVAYLQRAGGRQVSNDWTVVVRQLAPGVRHRSFQPPSSLWAAS